MQVSILLIKSPACLILCLIVFPATQKVKLVYQHQTLNQPKGILVDGFLLLLLLLLLILRPPCFPKGRSPLRETEGREVAKVGTAGVARATPEVPSLFLIKNKLLYGFHVAG